MNTEVRTGNGTKKSTPVSTPTGAKSGKTFVEYCNEMSVEDKTILAAGLSNECHICLQTAENWITGIRSPRWRLSPIITPYLNERGMKGGFDDLFPKKKPKTGLGTMLL